MPETYLRYEIRAEAKYVKKHREMGMSDKREDYISWDEYFMAVAQLAGMRSKDPHTQVGACIVSEDNKILSMGYNGFPRGCSDDEFPWGKTSENPLENKYLTQRTVN